MERALNHLYYCTYFGRSANDFKVYELNIGEDNIVYTTDGIATDLGVVEKDGKQVLQNEANDLIWEIGLGYFPTYIYKAEGLGRYIAFVESPERAQLFRQTCLEGKSGKKPWAIPEPVKVEVDGVVLPQDIVDAMKKIEALKPQAVEVEKIPEAELNKLVAGFRKGDAVAEKAVEVKVKGPKRDAYGRFARKG